MVTGFESPIGVAPVCAKLTRKVPAIQRLVCAGFGEETAGLSEDAWSNSITLLLSAPELKKIAVLVRSEVDDVEAETSSADRILQTADSAKWTEQS